MALVVKSFARTVTTAGTPVTLSTAMLHVVAFAVRAHYDNTGYIFMGDIATGNSTSGMFLAASESNEKEALFNTGGRLQEFNLNKIYIDASVSGDSVRVEYIAEES
jgi:hypothetical protein